MATTYVHTRMSVVDSSANVKVLYPETTGADVTVSRASNTNIPSSVATAQDLANVLAASAFAVPIDDTSTTSTTKGWSASKLNTQITAINSKLPFSLAISNNSYGYKTTSGTFVAFRGDSTDTYTYASGSTGGTVDLGARNNYRYVNASNVYSKGKGDGVTTHTGTYTLTSSDFGATKDMGATHTYRYISVPAKPSNTKTFVATTKSAKIDMGADNNYRYVNTSGVPYSNVYVSSHGQVYSLPATIRVGNPGNTDEVYVTVNGDRRKTAAEVAFSFG